MRRWPAAALICLLLVSCGPKKSSDPLVERLADAIAQADPLKASLLDASFLEFGQPMDFTQDTLRQMAALLGDRPGRPLDRDELGHLGGDGARRISVGFAGDSYCDFDMTYGAPSYPDQTVVSFQVGEEIGLRLYDGAVFDKMQALLEGARHHPGPLALGGSYVAVQFPRQVLEQYREEGRWTYAALLLEAGDRVLIWCQDVLWWVDTQDGAILYRAPVPYVGELSPGVEDFRAEAWDHGPYDFRLFTPDALYHGSTKTGVLDLAFTVPADLRASVAEPRLLDFDVNPDESQVLYTDHRRCWLEGPDGSPGREIFKVEDLRPHFPQGYDFADRHIGFANPRFLDDGGTVTAEVTDAAWTGALSMMRLADGKTVHFTELNTYSLGFSQWYYFQDRILTQLGQAVDTRTLTLGRWEQAPVDTDGKPMTAATYDGSWWVTDAWPLPTGQCRLQALGPGVDTPRTVLEVGEGKTVFALGATQSYLLRGYAPLDGAGLPRIVLVDCRP